MKLSGFSMAKNAHKLYYPLKEAVLSILPIVDEYIIALGNNDEDDTTKQDLLDIGSDKIKIIDTVWDHKQFPKGMIHAYQTDLAKEACSGDWLIHLQADEVIHEKYWDTIIRKCEQRLNDKRVDGFLFKYLHFFGDYWHLAHQHGWYQNEIRIIRNDPQIHSFCSAQSFRRIPDFDGISYRNKTGTQKLNVEALDAYVYHYGWVRPPSLMQNKTKAFYKSHRGQVETAKIFNTKPTYFDYGNMNHYHKFEGSHPLVMKDRIQHFNWGDQLHFEKGYVPDREPMKHEKMKYRILTYIENKFLGGRHLFPYSNWKKIKP